MNFESNIESYSLNKENSAPCVFDAQKKAGFESFEWIKENKSFLENLLLKHGVILLRNFNVYSLSEFNEVVKLFSPYLLEYVYRSTPRTRLGGRIYTATEYPSDRSILLHNENSYSKSWPEKIFFFSAIVASEGGETPIADSRKVFAKIDSCIKEKFINHGVMYVRNYTKEFDLSWQEVFQTENKADVETYCKEHNIQFIWRDGKCELTTKQICQAVHIHPKTKESVWFNQAHLFHTSSLDKASQGSIINELGEDNIPRNAFYGNGEPIDDEILNHIRDIYDQEKIKFKWQKGDIMILDNVLMAHGREPYKGERKVAVAMA